MAELDSPSVRAELSARASRYRDDVAKCDHEVAHFEAMEHMEVFTENWRQNRAKAARQLDFYVGLEVELARPRIPEGLTEPLRTILSLMCFQCAKFAHAYKAIGEFVDADGNELKGRAEDEQAFVLHRFLLIWTKHPNDWSEQIDAEIGRVTAAVTKLKESANA